jgi:hypothetical protein
MPDPEVAPEDTESSIFFTAGAEGAAPDLEDPDMLSRYDFTATALAPLRAELLPTDDK